MATYTPPDLELSPDNKTGNDSSNWFDPADMGSPVTTPVGIPGGGISPAFDGARVFSYKNNNSPYPMPERFNTLNPNGTLKSQYQLDMMKQRQMSPWALMQQQRLSKQMDRARGQVGLEANRGMMSGWNQLARSGGLSGGGRSALAKQALLARMKGVQDLYGKEADAMLGIQSNDINNQLKAEDTNIGRSLDQVDRDYKSRYDVWNELENQRAAREKSAAIASTEQDPGFWGNLFW